VLKREVVEGDQADAAQNRVSKFYRKNTTKRRKDIQPSEPPVAIDSEESVTERLLREAGEPEADQS
jgi:hypothetical protein